MPFCSSCGADVAGVKFCSKCGQPVEEPSTTASVAPGSAAAAPPPAAAPIANDNVLGAVAYVIIPAIIFLLVEPYNKNRFIRFHSLQCLHLLAAMLILQTANLILWWVPVLGWLAVIIWPILGLAGFIAWIVAVIKAFNGEEYRLPIIGDMAAQYV